MDNLFSDVKVRSIYLHDIIRVLPDKVVEGDFWLRFARRTRASLRRQRPSGHKTFTVTSLHICNIYDKKRGIGKKLIL